ncbi:hypothetical protein BsWGS_07837 [Bradybaena similaris]
MELEDDETYGGCNKIADNAENPEEMEQRQGMALENTAVEIVESVHSQESQQSGFEDRTVPIEKLPKTDNCIENSDANKVGDWNVLSGKETGMTSRELFVDEINDACREDNREVYDNIVLGHSLREAQMKIEVTPSLVHPSIMGNTDGRESDAAVVHFLPSCPGQPSIVHEVATKLQMEGGELDSGDREKLTDESVDVQEVEHSTSMSHIKDAGGIAKIAYVEANQTRSTMESVTDIVGQCQTTLQDNRFNAGKQGKSTGQDVQLNYFPALDNVDLETDEEGQDVEKDIDYTEEGQKVKGIRRSSEVASDSGILMSIGHSNGDSIVTLKDSTLHKDYPLNYQNYKVCRQVSPGVKECLILETGEQYFCITKPQAQLDDSPNPDFEVVCVNKSAPLIQPAHAGSECGYLDAIAETVNNNTAQPTSDSLSVFSRAEAFSYTSLQEDEQDKTYPSVCHLVDSNQHAYITENGVPVILDSAEDEGLDCEAENGKEIVHNEKGMMVGNKNEVLYLKRDEVPIENIVEDVLSSEGEINWPLLSSESNEYSMKKSKKEKQVKIFEPKHSPAVDVEKTADTSEMDINFNNSADHMAPEDKENTNENANSHRNKGRKAVHRDEACIQSSVVPSYRSKEPISVHQSQISTRYTCVHKSDPFSVASRPEPVKVPKFKTLQDQQVSWLDMFKVIEQQHRSELQSQYLEHQKILQEMQKNMEKELLKQQDTLKQRLMSHREMLEDLSPYRHAGQNINHSWTQSEDVSSMDSQRASDHGLASNVSQITLQGVPIALRDPPPMSRYHHNSHEQKFGDDLPVKRSLEKELHSPVKPADTSLGQAANLSIDIDKQLKGGVYSSPFPLAHVKHKKSLQASKSYENTQRAHPLGKMSHNSNSIHWGHDVRPHDSPSAASPDVSFADSDDVLSSRTRISLYEKHAKHLPDVRTYDDKELQKFRCEREIKAVGDGWTQNATVEQRILANENLELRQKYEHVQNVYHDAKIEIRELHQKIQGLEIRAADYADRYDAAQTQVLTLKSRLEELSDFIRGQESDIAQLESENRKNTDLMQIAYKKEKELADSLHSARSTIQKLVDKYETLEKDHNILKESLVETQELLYASRGEVIEVSTKLSRLELENKQLKHDIENLKLDLAMAPSSVRSLNNHPEEDADDRGGTTPDSESNRDYTRSPLIKAENEWKLRLQSREFTPKLQHKFYDREISSNYGGSPITVNHTSVHSADSPHSSKNTSVQDKRTHSVSHGTEIISRSSTSKSSYLSGSPKDGSRLRRDSGKHSPELTMVSNGLTNEDRMKSGEIVSRSAWEDVYTSLATSRPESHENTTSPMNYTRDQIIRDRLQNIDNLEKKYDDLTNEKRKFEAALSKLPVHGHGRQRDRLESELDRVDRDLGSVRMSLKRYHVLKSAI